MRDVLAAFLGILAIQGPVSAETMTMHGHCRIVTGEKFLGVDSGAAAICAEIEQAVMQTAPDARYSAEVKVLSPSRLAAMLVVNGKKLPEQNFAVMDRNLNPGSIKRFAQSLAEEVAKAAKP